MHTRLVHGPAVRALREALGIKHGLFAVDCLISPGYLTNIEKGIKQPSPAVTNSIAKRLGVSIDSITYVVSAEAKVPA
jgi:transcriptional regulator with XRE-family HTH domain